MSITAEKNNLTEDESGEAKGNIELECQVYAKPKAAVQWYKNGELIVENDYFQVIVNNLFMLMKI